MSPVKTTKRRPASECVRLREFLDRDMNVGAEVGCWFRKFLTETLGKRLTFFCWSIFILVLVGWEEGHCNLHSSFEKSIEILFWWYADEDMLFRRIRMLEERKLSINNSCGRSQGGCSNHPELFRWLPWHRSVKLKREEAYLSLCRKKIRQLRFLDAGIPFCRIRWTCQTWKVVQVSRDHESGWIFNF